MKKTILFAAALVAISFASCKKDQTCECVYTEGTGSTQIVSTTLIKAKTSKKSGKAWCDAAAVATTSSTYGGVAVPAGTTTGTTVCTIK